MRVLYRLYGEAEAEQDFFSSTTAASAYESFLVAVVSIHFFLTILIDFLLGNFSRNISLFSRLKHLEILFHRLINR